MWRVSAWLSGNSAEGKGLTEIVYPVSKSIRRVQVVVKLSIFPEENQKITKWKEKGISGIHRVSDRKQSNSTHLHHSGISGRDQRQRSV